MLRKRASHFTIFTAILACFVVLSSGCAAAVSPGGSRSGDATASGPVGKAVVSLETQSTGAWDPALLGGGSDHTNYEVLYDRLTSTPVDNLAKIPALATSWNMSPDGQTFTFELRKGVKFHNGDELTPEDVVFSVEREKRLGAASTKAYLENYLDSVTAQSNSVVFRLKIPTWTFVGSISGDAYSVVPKKYVEKVGDDGFIKAPIGTGPFKFVEGSKQEYLEVEAIEDHFMTKPGVKRLRYVTVPEETTRLAMIKTGEADLAMISVASLQALKGDSKVKALKVPYPGGMRLFTWGQQDPKNPFSKLEVRQALSIAMDRQAIADKVFQGYARAVADGHWNPAQPGWPEWGWDAPKQDLQKAKELLVKAGYPDGKGIGKITFQVCEYGPSPGWTLAAPVIAEDWRKLGLDIEVRRWDWDTLYATNRAGKWDPLSISSATANGSGDLGYIAHDLSPRGNYLYASGAAYGLHPEATAMVDQFQQEFDPKKRDEILQKIMVFARDNVTSIPVVIQDGLWASGPRVIDYKPRPGTISYGNMWTLKVAE